MSRDHDLRDVRRDYGLEGLDEATAGSDPIELFTSWMRAATAAEGLVEPTAMTLATVDETGRPRVRVVLLKHFDASGFAFYTNHLGDKGRELAVCPEAALCLWWDRLERQVRIEGRVGKVAAAESDAYFASRPRGSQVAAWASPQSRVVPGRADLEERLAAADAEFAGRPVPRPPHWGGYRVVPRRIEFWQGRPNRLHDRLAYTREPDGSWRRVRLAP